MQFFAKSSLIVAMLLVARAASACPVCGAVTAENSGAYLLMTGIMSALPLLFMGGVIGWLVRRVRAAEGERNPAEAEIIEARGEPLRAPPHGAQS